MIKSNLGTVEIKGPELVVAAELECLFEGLQKFFSKEQILRIVDDAYKSEEEKKQEREKIRAKLDKKDKKLSDLLNAFEKFFWMMKKVRNRYGR